MINYEPVFNKMTKDTFDKFIEIYNIAVPRSGTKNDYKKNFQQKFNDNSDAETAFQNFYKRLELAGRKHFYLFKINTSELRETDLLGKVSNIPDESERTFDPKQDDGKTFKKVEGHCITVKRFQIRKSYTFVKDVEENDFLSKQYAINIIHYVMFATFDFVNRQIVCGYDSCGDYLDKKKQDEELFDFLNLITGKKIRYESLLTSSHIDRLKYLPNCLAYSISNKANAFDQAKFKKTKANFDKILSDLLHEKYKISEIKENNPDFDLQTNVLYNAGLSASLDNDFDLINDDFEFYYFTDVIGKPYYFRIRFDVRNGGIITFSEAITWEELKDVLRQII